MNQKKKAKYVGMAGALLVHVFVIILLLAVSFTLPQKQEEGGVPVLMGEVPEAAGKMDPSLVEVDVMQQENAQSEALPKEVLSETGEQPVITQEEEETVAIPSKDKSKKEEVKQPDKQIQEKKKEDKAPKKEPTEAEKAEAKRRKAEAEAARKAAEAEKARKEAEEAARKRVAGAFGKGAKMNDKGSSQGSGIKGSPEGNAPSGKPTGTEGYGSWDLGGRSIGEGGLPHPVYNVQDEGRVVVDITVNPEGRVIATGINRHTNTVNPALRKAAEDAARKARFNAVSGLNNQQGTITYYFNLK